MQYYFRDREKVYGPYTAKQVRSMRANDLLNNLTPFTVERPLSQRIGAIAALTALFAIIVLCVALLTLFQKPLPTQVAANTVAGDGAGTGTKNSPAASILPGADGIDGTSTDDGAGAGETPGNSVGEIPNAEAETPGDAETSTETTDSTDSGAGEAPGDTETPTEITNEDEDVGETYYKLDDGSGGIGSGDNNRGGGSATASVFGASGTGNQFVFVLDRSGSMSGQPFDAARKELLRAISKFKNKQQINVIVYDHQFETLFPQLMPASDANKNAVRNFLHSLAPRGGTEIVQPLIAAVRMNPDIVFVITDAQITITEADYQQILKLCRYSRINVIQFGGFDSPPLQKLARATGGKFVKHANF